MMKNAIGMMLFAGAFLLCVPGCGSEEPKNIAAEVEQSEIEKYEAAVKAEEAAANAGMAAGMKESEKP